MRIRHILVVAFGVNLLLLAGAFWQINQRRAASVATPVPTEVSSTSVAPSSEANEVIEFAPPTPPEMTNVVVNRAFQWADLESDDYLELAANLRAAGCPEATVRDIVMARAKDDFAARRWELLRPLQVEFWDRLARGESLNRLQVPDDLERQFNELKERANAVMAGLERALPARPEPEEADDMATLAFLPSDKLAAAKALRQQLRDRVGAINEPDAGKRRAAGKVLADGYEAALRALMDEGEWTEYELRRSGAARWLQGAPGFDLGTEEVRALVRHWQTNQVDPRSQTFAERRAAIAAVVGGERAETAHRLIDPDHEIFFKIARRLGLSADVARSAGTTRDVARAEAAAVRERAYPDEETRARAAAALLLGAKTELREIYGEPARQVLDKYGLAWMDELFAGGEAAAP